MDVKELKDNLNTLFDYVKKGNNLGEPITVIGATKTVDVQTINNAIKLGLRVVAENKVQEFRDKTNFIDKSASQHFIGHLQKNKVKYLVGKVDLIHSVDNFELASEISRLSVKNNVTSSILLQINIGNEDTKSGFDVKDGFTYFENIKALPNLIIKGYMCMLPNSEDQEYLSSLCKKMRELYDCTKKYYDISVLSMGMSHDYKIAVNNGSNAIRIGSAIFGKRNY